MKTYILSTLIALFALLTGPAQAAPSLEVVDDGEQVLVYLHGVSFTDATARPKGPYIEIELIGAEVKAAKTFAKDKTVTSVETVGHPRPRLYVEMRKGKEAAVQTASLIRVEPWEDGLRVTVPRNPVKSAVPEPVSVAGPAPAPREESTAAPAPKEASAPKEAAPSKEPLLPQASTPLQLKEPESSGMGALTYGLIALLLVGCGALAFWAKRRQAIQGPNTKIKVVATHDLGGKAKLMLLSAGDKELLLSVSDQGARLLERWKSPNGPGEAQVSEPVSAPAPAAKNAPRPGPRLAPVPPIDESRINTQESLRPSPIRLSQPQQAKPQSAAVAGLLRLKNQSAAPAAGAAAAAVAAAPAPSQEIDEQDEDANWARELIALTKQQGGAS